MENDMTKKELEIKLEKNLKWQKKVRTNLKAVEKLKAEEKRIRKELKKFEPKEDKKKFKKIVKDSKP